MPEKHIKIVKLKDPERPGEFFYQLRGRGDSGFDVREFPALNSFLGAAFQELESFDQAMPKIPRKSP